MAESVDWQALNRSNWDSRVPVHLASKFYDVPGFRASGNALPEFELAEAGDVTGKRLVHLQCHVGLDTLSWAKRGARVSGLDFSEPAISAAAGLARDLGIDASFVVSDVYSAASAFDGQRFDVVYTGKGALVWLPDMPRWARVVASLLSPGGFLYLVEGHPFAQVLSSSGGDVAYDYFDSAPIVENFLYSYTDGPELAQPRHVEFQHPISSVVSALASAGLRIDFLHEHDFDCFARFEGMEPGDDGLYRLPAGRLRVPLQYSLRATRVA